MLYHEPWQLLHDGCVLADANGEGIADVDTYVGFECLTKDQAERIRLCVNVCAGVPNEILATATPKISMQDNTLILACRVEDLPGYLRKCLEEWERDTRLAHASPQ